MRVEAGRLRRALDQYYAGEGAADPVQIDIPRGGYVPRFLPAGAPDRLPPPAAEAAAAPLSIPAGPSTPQGSPIAVARPVRSWAAMALAAVLSLAVVLIAWRLIQPPPVQSEPMTSASRTLPVIRIDAAFGPDEYINQATRRFQVQLAEALSRFDEFIVLDSEARAVFNGRLPAPTYVIEHRGEGAGSAVAATIRLVHAATGRIVWTSSSEQNVARFDMATDTRELSRRAAVKLAQPYGVLHADLRDQKSGAGPLACVIRAYDYWLHPGEQRHGEARDCLERELASNPDFHPAWAVLAFIHLDEYRVGYNPRGGDVLAQAQSAARRAMLLAPESARAMQAMMAVQMVRGETAAAIDTGFQAIRRNPFDTDLLADVGARLIQAGRGMEGRPLLLRAADVNPTRPAWHEFYLLLSARDGNDRIAVERSVNLLRGNDGPLALLGLAIAASDRGDIVEAQTAIRRLAEVSPVFAKDPSAFLDRAFFAPPVKLSILASLDASGLRELLARTL